VSAQTDRDPDQSADPRDDAAGLAIPDPILAAVEGAVNRYLDLDPEGAQGFAPLYGRIIGIEVRGLGVRLTLVPGPDRIQVFGAYDATPDCLIRGAPLALLRMVTSEQKDTEISSGAVEIQGDSTLAHELAKAFAGLDVDWEEQLSRVVGDSIAHPVGEGLRRLGRWGRRSAETLTLDLKEYLEEEARLLPTRYELADFLADVDTLRDDVERLQARIERLARRRSHAHGGAAAKARSKPRGKRTKEPGPDKG